MEEIMKATTPEDIIEGVVEHIVFYNEENGYTVFVLRLDKEDDTLDSDELTCIGHTFGITPGEEVQVTGNFVNNPKYGRQLAIQQLDKKIPTTLAGIEKYLGSGVIKGVGERLARRIVEAFGEDTFDVIAEAPEKLTVIKGITAARATKIAESFHDQAAQRRAILFLQEYGISPAMAVKIFKKYKNYTVDIVKHNPYKLADDIDGIGFKIADDIARRMGIAFDEPFRIAAGVRFCLWEATSNGHIYLPKPVLLTNAVQILGVEKEIVENTIRQMQIDRQVYCERSQALCDGETVVFLSSFYSAEVNVARKLYALAEGVEESHRESLRQVAIDSIASFQKESEKELSQGQQEAVREAIANSLLIVTGGPGTGKTTVINTVIHLLASQKLRIELAAPTGRAAKRMADAVGREAKTLHRLLESTYIAEDSRRQSFQRNEDNPIETDVLIIDEASMVDIMLMQHVLKAVPQGTRLILVGDADQLPPVGPGNVLKDLINSGCVKVVRLTEIFRQAQESAIVMNAHRINRGEYPVVNEGDFFFMRRGYAEGVIETVSSLVGERLPKYLGDNVDIQVLTPMRKTPLGVQNLNQELQKHLNPPEVGKREREFRSTIFREGDKVMQIRNNYQMSWKMLDSSRRYVIDEGEGVYNGDGGIIKSIDENNETITVLFDDNRRVDYEFSQLDELELAYAITVHKSQGSEYTAVVLPIHSGPPMLLSRNLLYTAVTRAKTLCVIVGLSETLQRMLDNNREVDRYTALSHRIKAVFGRV